MDSKLRKITVLCTVLMVSLIIGAFMVISLIKNDNTTAYSRLTDAQAARNAEGKTPGEAEMDYSAFLQDETFFDKEKSDYEKLMERYGKKLSLYATSVERDLRIHVLNEMGELVTGEELYVTLDGEEYKDLDRDGIIYVGDLKPGEYEVALQELKDYKIPSSPMEIHVKEKVEYIPIDDISLLIKTEDEIDAEKEDTRTKDASEDADGSEVRDIQASEGNRSFGIDVSKWNKEIDWQAVKASGVDFAIIRCGYRGSVTGALVEDPYFYQNLQGAKKAGIQVGLYFFTQAVSAVEAVEEASMALCLIDGGELEYPIFIDTEGAGGNGRADRLDTAARTQVCEAFCETIENAGYQSGVYASRNWLYHNLDAARLDDKVIWLAEYREQPEYTGKYQMWQYTSGGSIKGIEGKVDFNLSFMKE